MFPTLILTSPHKQGQEVRDAEWLMQGHGRFGEKYYTGPLDGEYGPLAGAASYRAKFWLGYRLSECNHAFGPLLYSYLLPLEHKEAKKLPLVNRIRRAYRIKNKPKPSTADKALQLAQTFLGYREGPGNQNMFGRFFGIDFNPWCGAFVSYCITKSGKRVFYPYVPNIVSWARAGEHGLFTPSTARPGDLVCWDWTGDGLYDHVEFVEKLLPQGIQTIGGNTLPPGGTGDRGNGGGVYRNIRPWSTRHAFARISGT